VADANHNNHNSVIENLIDDSVISDSDPITSSALELKGQRRPWVGC
jgi:hypothetical protein